MAEDDQNAFNRSILTSHSPPASSASGSRGAEKKSTVDSKTKGKSKAGTSSKYAETEFMTQLNKYACNTCEEFDMKLKIRCGLCKTWKHMGCDGGKITHTGTVNAGLWVCSVCLDVNQKKDSTLEESVVERSEKNNEPMSASQATKEDPKAAESTTITGMGGIASGFPTDITVIPSMLPKQSAAPGKPRSQLSNKGYNGSVQTIPRKKGTKDDPHSGPVASDHPPPPPVSGSQHNTPAPQMKTGNNHGSSRHPSSRASKNSVEYLRMLDADLEIRQQEIELQKQLALLEASRQHLRKKMSVYESEEGSSKHSMTHKSPPHLRNLPAPVNVVSSVRDWLNKSNTQKEDNDDELPLGGTRPKKLDHASRTKQQPLERTRVTKVDIPSSVPKPPQDNPQITHIEPQSSMSILNPNMTVSRFVNEISGFQGQDVFNISKNQARARHVVSKDQPEYTGDPTEWPSFVTRFQESTRRCGFSDAENLDRLTRYLKGKALNAVKSELYKENALPSVMSTLKLLYGRPDIVYDALIQQIKNVPPFQAEQPEMMVLFSMKIKCLCDTLRTAEMNEYLHNPLLLRDLVEKLPTIYKVMWGNHVAEMQSRQRVNVEQFDYWLRIQAEISSTISKTTHSITAMGNSYNKPRNKAVGFQGLHQVNTTPKPAGHCNICVTEGHHTASCTTLKTKSVNDRWELIKQLRLCFGCFGKHRLESCQSNRVCRIDSCRKRHHPLLHDTGVRNQQTSIEEVQEYEQPLLDTESGINARSQRINLHVRNRSTLFQIIPVLVSDGNGKEVQTHAFLDSGSEVTLVEASLAKELGVRGKPEKLNLKWSNNTRHEEEGSRRVQLTVLSADKSTEHLLKNVRTVKDLSLPTQSMPTQMIQQLPHLRFLPIDNYEAARPRLLIGLDNFQLLIPQQTAVGAWNEPVAVKTYLGWTVFGNPTNCDNAELLVNTHQLNTDDSLHSLVDEYFSMENIGIEAPRTAVESHTDKRAREIMKRTTKQHSNGRYECGLLWSRDEVELPDSYNMAMNRFRQFERRMAKVEGQREMVNNIIREYREKDFLEEVPLSNYKSSTLRTWYLPIFMVENPNKDNKIRLVWDAAATVNGISLNSNLLSGPDMLASLPATLMTFRERPYAVGGDIEKMFHQILMKAEDRDAQRCLWRENSDDKVQILRMKVMTFGAACSPTIAQYVKNSHSEKYRNKYPRAVNAIQKSKNPNLEHL